MVSRISEICNRKVHCIFQKDKKESRSESGPLFQPLPKASDDEEKVEDVDIWKHISELRKPIEKRNHKKARSLHAFSWPKVAGLIDLEGIILLRSDLPITDIHEDVKAILGRVNVATVAAHVVAHTLERLDASINNTKEIRYLAEVMYDVATVLRRLSESPERTQDVMEEATALIVEGARVFSLQHGPRKGGPPRSAADINAIGQKLDNMYRHIITPFTFDDFTPMQHRRSSHLLKKYHTHAESGPFSQALPGAFHDEAPLPASSGYYDPVPLLASPGYYASSEDYDPVPSPASSGYYDPLAAYYDPVKASFSGSFNVSMESKGKNVDVSLNVSGTPRCDEASSSGYSDLPKRSEGDDVNVNLNISGAPRCDEALKTLSESPEETQDVMQEATSLIVEGARVFSLQGGHRRSASEVRQKLTEFTVPVFTPILHQRRSHLSKEYLTHADNGQVEEDLLLTGQVEEDLLSTGRQKVFKMEDLEVATKYFHEDNKVGKGGFGAVYKGTTHDGKQIAVKKMSFTSHKKQFENEKLVAKVQHRNLVDLLGSCEQESQGCLVYEYFPNQSLDKFLFDPEKRKLLDWHKRYNIIQGIARGLQYLHEDSRVLIVHRDIKAGNILLDENLNPKIVDFGIANLFPEDRTHVTATSPAGTIGYMPPEYFMTMRFSVRTDVYCFGILLLEILTGEVISSDALKFLGWVWSSYNRKEALQTIDPTIIETWYKEAPKALRCIQVGLLCVQGDIRRRPKMSEVIAMLSTYESLPDPKNPPCLPSYCATQENGNSAMEKLMFNSE